MRKKIFATLLCVAFILVSYGQNTYVSKPIVDAMNAGKFYMKTYGLQSDDEDEDNPIEAVVTMEMAQKGNVILSSANMGGMEISNLFANGKRYMLDYNTRTYQTFPGMPGQTSMMGRLSFRQQGTCKVNGEDGWYYDEYSSNMGTSVTFYYNSNKVAAVDLGEMSEGAVALHSFNKRIPDHVKLGITTGWKGQGSPAPPTVASGYKDPDTSNEMACGGALHQVVVTDKRPLSSPMYVSRFSAPSGGSQDVAAASHSFSAEGVATQMKMYIEKMKDMTDGEVASLFLQAGENDAIAIAAGQVDDILVEQAVARAILLRHVSTYNDAGCMLRVTGHTEEAVKVLEEAYKAAPENPLIGTSLVDCYVELHRLDKAQPIVIDLVRANPERGDVYASKAQVCLERLDLWGAVKEMFTALSLGYCDETMAGFLSQLPYAITEPLANENKEGGLATFKEAWGKAFSPENLELLRKGSHYGKEWRATGSRHNFRWNYDIGEVQSIYKHLDRVAGEENKRAEDFANQMGTPNMYLSMGFPELKQLAVHAEGEIFDMSDAAQFWSIYLLSIYHQRMLDYACGNSAWELDQEKHILAGWYPSAYAKYMTSLRNLESNHKTISKEVDEWQETRLKELEESPSKEGMKAVYRVLAEAARRHHEACKTMHFGILSAYKTFYNSSIKPTMEEYWNDIDPIYGCINDEEARNYFYFRMCSDIAGEFAKTISAGHYAGFDIDATYKIWQQRQSQLQALIDAENEAQAEIERQEIEQREARLAEIMDLGLDPLDEDVRNPIPDVSLNILDLPFSPSTWSIGMRDGRFFFEKRDNMRGTTKNRDNSFTKVVEGSDVYLNGGERMQEKWVEDAEQGMLDAAINFLKDKLPFGSGNVLDAATGAQINSSQTAEKTYVYGSNGQLLRTGKQTTTKYDMPGLGGFFVKVDSESRHHATTLQPAVRRTRYGYGVGFAGLNLTIIPR